MPKFTKSETFILSIPALAVDWNKPEEDEAWASLQTHQKRKRTKQGLAGKLRAVS